MIRGKKHATFTDTVNAILAAGATVVPGTNCAMMASHRKRNGDAYLQSRYSIVLEGSPEMFEELDTPMEG
jgi:hypothetical protein